MLIPSAKDKAVLFLFTFKLIQQVINIFRHTFYSLSKTQEQPTNVLFSIAALLTAEQKESSRTGYMSTLHFLIIFTLGDKSASSVN